MLTCMIEVEADLRTFSPRVVFVIFCDIVNLAKFSNIFLKIYI
jgi:hypothetical protein